METPDPPSDGPRIGAITEAPPGTHPHIAGRRLFHLMEQMAMPITGTTATFHFAARPAEQMRALLNHRQTLLQLAQTGGVSWPEMAAIMLDRDVDPDMHPDIAAAACQQAVQELSDRIAHD